ncbi:MAG: hypothetical protein QG652_837 [Pseudomonadota bacterium]|nr:hypothetical protein [Pseudomonadota bacterium]
MHGLRLSTQDFLIGICIYHLDLLIVSMRQVRGWKLDDNGITRILMSVYILRYQ